MKRDKRRVHYAVKVTTEGTAIPCYGQRLRKSARAARRWRDVTCKRCLHWRPT